MFRKIFSYDGKVMGVLNKIGEIILLNMVFLLCCLPVVTAGPAATSFYYAMVKSVRRERGTCIGEFFRSMKRTLAKGTLLTVAILLWTGLLYVGRRGAAQRAGGGVTFELALYNVAAAVSALILLYIFPVFSRFDRKMSDIVKLSFVMSIRYFPFTLAIGAGSVLTGWLLLFELPAPCILAVPGLWCYLVTYMMEKALLHYMPAAKPGEEQWYDG